MTELICYKCSHKNVIFGTVGRKDECLKCHEDLHSCKHCHFYDKNSYNECQEPSADVVKEKERSNFCDYFKPRAGGNAVDEKAKLKAAADALFKKG